MRRNVGTLTSALRHPDDAAEVGELLATLARGERDTVRLETRYVRKDGATVVVHLGAALIREREHGTIDHLLVMPVTPLEIMAGKIWAMTLVVLVACALSLLFVVQGLLAVPIEGSIGLFLAGAAMHLFATTSMGVFLGTVARSMPQFGLLLILVLIPLEMLSGGTTPRESMPRIVQDIMLVAPTTHFVLLAQAVLFRGAGFAVVWPQFAALAGIGAVLFSLALFRLRKSIGEPT